MSIVVVAVAIAKLKVNLLKYNFKSTYKNKRGESPLFNAYHFVRFIKAAILLCLRIGFVNFNTATGQFFAVNAF